jgi:hypothetical protein
MDGRRMSGLLGALLAVGVLAGCSSGSKSESASAAAPVEANGGAGAAKPDSSPGGPAQQQQPQPQQQQAQVNQPGVDRKLIRTASLELTAPNVVDVANRARDVAVGLSGFAGQEDVNDDTATIALQIPSDRFDKALEQLSGLGTVRSRSEKAEDVTEQMVDVDSRIATQRASVDRVRALLDKAQTVSDIVSIESEVTKREADLESLEKRREALSGQVALSTVTVRISKGSAPPPPPAPSQDSGGFLAGLSGGWHAFLATGGVVLRVLGAVLPFVAVLGIPGFYAVRAWRRRRRPAVPVTQAES